MPTAQYVSDYVPWDQLIAPGLLRCKSGEFQRVFRVRGRDPLGLSREAQGARMLQANEVIKRLGGKWLLQSEAQRTRFTDYVPITWTNPVAALIDADRRHAVTEAPGSRETRYYVTMTWQPPSPVVQQARRWFVANLPPETADGGANAMAMFWSQSQYFLDLLRGVLAVCEPCTTNELLTYLHTKVSDSWHPVVWSGNALNIDAQLCDRPYVGGWYPQLGDWHLRTCSFTGYPAVSHTEMVRHLERLDLDFSWSTRWDAHDRAQQAKLLQQTQYAWVQQEKGFFTRAFEVKSGREARVIDVSARQNADETVYARQELGADIVAYGGFTSTITVWDTEPQRANAKLDMVRQAFEAQGFVLQIEKHHAFEAWQSALPGNRQSSVRKTLHSSLFLTHLLPGLQAAWLGPERDVQLDGPPWFYAHTDTSSIFRVVQHVRDVGHHMLMGPTGTGKSTMLGLGIAQWYKYARARAIVFDVGRTARLITLLLGGQWIDLGAGQIALQPLRDIDQHEEFTWALSWLVRIACVASGKSQEHRGLVQEYLAARLRQVAQLPASARTLHALLQCCQEQTRKAEARSSTRRDGYGLAQPDERKEQRLELQRDVQRAIRALTREGEFGYILDGNRDPLAETPLVTFEQETLLRFQGLTAPVIQYVFHACERRFTTETPTFLALEEAALVAIAPLYRDKFDEWLMTSRKKGVSVGFVVNSVRQTAGQVVGLLTEDNCPTRFYFPNAEAVTPSTMAVYQQLGVDEAECHVIAGAVPYQDVYYVNRELGRRLFHLPLSQFVLDSLARNDARDHVRMDALLADHGPEGFAAAWYDALGYVKAAQACREREHVCPAASASSFSGVSS